MNIFFIQLKNLKYKLLITGIDLSKILWGWGASIAPEQYTKYSVRIVLSLCTTQLKSVIKRTYLLIYNILNEWRFIRMEIISHQTTHVIRLMITNLALSELSNFVQLSISFG